jgi:hypothetical protein
VLATCLLALASPRAHAATTDSFAPEPFVRIADGRSELQQVEGQLVTIRWTPQSADDAPVTRMRVCFARERGGCLPTANADTLVPFFDVDFADLAAPEGVQVPVHLPHPLVHGDVLVACVDVEDAAGNRSFSWECDSVVVDQVAPTAPVWVKDAAFGFAPDLDYASYEKGSLQVGTDIDGVGSDQAYDAGCVTTTFTCAPDQITWAQRFRPPALTEGAFTRHCYQSVDVAGNASPFVCSDGFWLDTLAPWFLGASLVGPGQSPDSFTVEVDAKDDTSPVSQVTGPGPEYRPCTPLTDTRFSCEITEQPGDTLLPRFFAHDAAGNISYVCFSFAQLGWHPPEPPPAPPEPTRPAPVIRASAPLPRYSLALAPLGRSMLLRVGSSAPLVVVERTTAGAARTWRASLASIPARHGVRVIPLPPGRRSCVRLASSDGTLHGPTSCATPLRRHPH